ncbi:hypothetical protein GE09DRAFT_263246 [Coniochaeta sp. 2T2.1]|nr:hypothetical protein GE09DRAFT_263246 [Coniochaeta sp. 2T2.1]
MPGLFSVITATSWPDHPGGCCSGRGCCFQGVLLLDRGELGTWYRERAMHGLLATVPVFRVEETFRDQQNHRSYVYGNHCRLAPNIRLGRRYRGTREYLSRSILKCRFSSTRASTWHWNGSSTALQQQGSIASLPAAEQALLPRCGESKQALWRAPIVLVRYSPREGDDVAYHEDAITNKGEKDGEVSESQGYERLTNKSGAMRIAWRVAFNSVAMNPGHSMHIHGIRRPS